VDVSVHHFSDAADDGYGQASYIRLVNEKNDVFCSLLIGKGTSESFEVHHYGTHCCNTLSEDVKVVARSAQI